jgi:hypothetical protein
MTEGSTIGNVHLRVGAGRGDLLCNRAFEMQLADHIIRLCAGQALLKTYRARAAEHFAIAFSPALVDFPYT